MRKVFETIREFQDRIAAMPPEEQSAMADRHFAIAQKALRIVFWTWMLLMVAEGVYLSYRNAEHKARPSAPETLLPNADNSPKKHQGYGQKSWRPPTGDKEER